MAKNNAVILELKNSQASNTILTGMLSGVERIRMDLIVATVNYRGLCVTIPLNEMMIELKRPAGQSDEIYNERSIRILNKMLGADIDFIVCGIDQEEKAVVGSRQMAMLQKRRLNFLIDDPQIYAGCVVEARIVAVSQLSVRVDVCGVETTIRAHQLSWGFLEDARDVYSIGDFIQVEVIRVTGKKAEELNVTADVRSLLSNTNRDNLEDLKLQSNYIGTISGTKNKAMFVDLVNGAHGIAHKCYYHRKPQKGDKVVFIPTRKDLKSGVAIGLISRIINKKQHGLKG